MICEASRTEIAREAENNSIFEISGGICEQHTDLGRIWRRLQSDLILMLVADEIYLHMMLMA